jgi:hypothetical protein
MTDNKKTPAIDLTPEFYNGEYWFTREQVREMERLGTTAEELKKYITKTEK